MPAILTALLRVRDTESERDKCLLGQIFLVVRSENASNCARFDMD